MEVNKITSYNIPFSTEGTGISPPGLLLILPSWQDCWKDHKEIMHMKCFKMLYTCSLSLLRASKQPTNEIPQDLSPVRVRPLRNPRHSYSLWSTNLVNHIATLSFWSRAGFLKKKLKAFDRLDA